MQLTKRDKYLRKKYGITEAIFQRMLTKGRRACWICKKAPKTRILNVDHDHKTGQVRGLLCFFCNKYLIGRRRQEHAGLFSAAAGYLLSKQDWRKA